MGVSNAPGKARTARGHGAKVQRSSVQLRHPVHGLPVRSEHQRDQDRGRLAKDTAVDTAVWVKGQGSSRLSSGSSTRSRARQAGIDWLSRQIRRGQGVRFLGFDTIRDGLAALIQWSNHFARRALNRAFQAMNADDSALPGIYSSPGPPWSGRVRATIDGVLGLARTLWETASAYVSTLRRGRGIIDSWPFRQLPDFLAVQGARSSSTTCARLGPGCGTSSRVLNDLRARARQILESIEAFVARIVDIRHPGRHRDRKRLAEAWEFVKALAADPIGLIQPHIDKLAATLNAEAPPKAKALGNNRSKRASASSRARAS